MTPSITETLAAQSTDPPAPEHATTHHAVQPPPPDTVTLSEPAQVSELRAQGQSPLEIAENLGISVSTVDADLGIIATNAAPPPVHVAHAGHAAYPASEAPATKSTEGTSAP
jgi:hypothetical protein